ncbi:HNH endonuclease [Streptomyces sp. NPDC006872]|uniref:HNH endonuclease n=1 Tax=Streptomyces sp. NPDC006872 TaxID=3155720 RepID=UPI0033DEC638
MARRRRGKGWLSRREYALKRRCEEWGVPYEKVSRAAVFRRNGWICQLCGNPVDRAIRFPKPLSASLDHIVPLSHGPGTPGHVAANCQLAHLGCNSSKGNRV